MRLGEISNALTIIASAPWVGVGWGVGDRSIDLEFTRGVSNIYLTIAQRSGIPAVVAYVTAWGATGALIWRGVIRMTRDHDDDGIALGASAAVAGALASGMVDHHFVSFPHLVTLLAIVAGICVARAAAAQSTAGTVSA
jgi:O-antigen ligase